MTTRYLQQVATVCGAVVVSAVVAFVAVKWLLRYIQSHRFTAFAYYRFALGAALLLLIPVGE